MLKKLNRSGQSAFAADRDRKSRYTFEVLYRKANAPSRPKQDKAAKP